MAASCIHHNASRASTNNSGTPVSILIVSHTPIPVSIKVFALIKALALAQIPIPGLPGLYKDENLQKATKLVLKLFVWSQKHSQFQANFTPCEWILKAWFLDLLMKFIPKLLLLLPIVWKSIQNYWGQQA